ncbi:2-succinyl-5-enolpyruvyl-6-hydroxy-3-cyclohexene-1-carboxylate synthase [Pedococcus dokdonensis]|uniref:2-succinyl-5-enolpyruvyl-6-hydroxy-3-cyclohexene-1-carboxylate synthase n=1 Tax=Pedococcus dokdonensis TaxID=443156 RepID=A0A1H0V0D0_9MICO|nr:2-succinyl-5-enolpyruvyl-6-hydroxy-3-cyclohexene-1-carboxylic-acid synthase [Pedococcus dokdonensis]SDP71907.1 2-succinyl-5-enolpyruvyl-6-hydroxy-3-cyclohexene-1-carboxylate synthase [Pedococcus dokdonensis]
MNPSTALATVLVDELVRQGIRHAVLCPGSRSAPLAYALREAERAGRLELHVRVDERSAGFLALGLAKLTRVPAVVVTTSGTAVANLHPAVLEAHHGVVPLVVLTADRPVELRGTGANQTTTQPGIFADATRWSVDAAAPTREAGEVARWRGLAAQAVGHATGNLGDEDGREPGPVHLNVQLREPLVPTGDDPWPEPLEGPQGPAPVPGSTAVAPTPVADVSRGVGRTLVVIGDLPEPDQFARAVRWATARGWPLVAEPFGTHPRPEVIPHGPMVLSDPGWLDEHAPDRVVAVGRLTLSRPVAALLRRPGVRIEAVGAHAWIVSRPDVQAVHPVSVLDGPDPLPSDGSDRAWADAWRAAGERVAEALAGDATQNGSAPWPSGAGVAEAVLAALPAGATLFLGSSNSARDVDLAAPRSEPLRVVASRGLAGIDGCVSTASGLALAGASPTYALMGDLTFLHDANGLLVGPGERRPDLTVVVTNDDGGGVFTLLEPGEPQRAAEFERLFGTPTGADLAALCAAHHVPHRRIASRAELVEALASEPSGLTVLEVPVDRASHRDLHGQLRTRAASAIRG